MAWKEQCQIAFGVAAKKYVHKGMNVREALRTLSEESGIPYKTLHRWYYEKGLKNETPNANGSNNDKNNADIDDMICPQCQINERRKQRLTDGNIRIHTLCIACANQQQKQKNERYLKSLNTQVKNFNERLSILREREIPWNTHRGFTKNNCLSVISSMTKTLTLWKEIENA